LPELRISSGLSPGPVVDLLRTHNVQFVVVQADHPVARTLLGEQLEELTKLSPERTEHLKKNHAQRMEKAAPYLLATAGQEVLGGGGVEPPDNQTRLDQGTSDDRPEQETGRMAKIWGVYVRKAARRDATRKVEEARGDLNEEGKKGPPLPHVAKAIVETLVRNARHDWGCRTVGLDVDPKNPAVGGLYARTQFFVNGTADAGAIGMKRNVPDDALDWLLPVRAPAPTLPELLDRYGQLPKL
jgi:hypothetical protein